MRDTNNRKRLTKVTLQNITFCFVIIFGITSIFITIVYTIPVLSSFFTNRWYISPLSQEFSTDQILADTMTEKNVKEKLKKAKLVVKNISDSGDYYTVLLKTGEKIILSKKKSLTAQISSLQLISSRFTIEGKHFVSLDFRFDRPVLVSK